jgi:hypothetical protein
MSFFTTVAILISPIAILWRAVLVLIVFGLTWWEMKSFLVQNIALHGDKILLTIEGKVYEAGYQLSSVVTRYLCFLHLQALDSEKRWRIPVSRLEFPGDSFRQLKCKLQRFSMGKN